ncbi:hypothetical protein INN71_10670 [Nocardioides sp. ChNu-153]|uniref:hypothetical protein n=1 Tax=unclassified Nocardioides TaxID=2615069 RepID=UPI0024071BC4|nr:MULTISPECIES: hypothetical protein [unclassified Nocardioides]MDF9715747.1 hypothetical protein [Nocardioides sp. ChNu-99]MDN7121852.1 hypothetical protein [Nocardioides sp. ChNu-153]
MTSARTPPSSDRAARVLLLARARLLGRWLVVSAGVDALALAWGLQMYLFPGPHAVVGNVLAGMFLAAAGLVWGVLHLALAGWVAWGRGHLRSGGTHRLLVAGAWASVLVAGGSTVVLLPLALSPDIEVLLVAAPALLSCIAVLRTGLVVGGGPR